MLLLRVTTENVGSSDKMREPMHTTILVIAVIIIAAALFGFSRSLFLFPDRRSDRRDDEPITGMRALIHHTFGEVHIGADSGGDGWGDHGGGWGDHGGGDGGGH